MGECAARITSTRILCNSTGEGPPQAPDGMNGRGDGLQKSGHILYTKGCPIPLRPKMSKLS